MRVYVTKQYYVETSPFNCVFILMFTSPFIIYIAKNNIRLRLNKRSVPFQVYYQNQPADVDVQSFA